ncbi:MAG: ATP-binding cassette domain-containing protein [Spirochaetota bacterium]
MKLSIKGLTASPLANRGKVILSDISLGLDPHEILFVVGQSGAGKSTLIKAILKNNDRHVVHSGNIAITSDAGDHVDLLNESASGLYTKNARVIGSRFARHLKHLENVRKKYFAYIPQNFHVFHKLVPVIKQIYNEPAPARGVLSSLAETARFILPSRASAHKAEVMRLFKEAALELDSLTGDTLTIRNNERLFTGKFQDDFSVGQVQRLFLSKIFKKKGRILIVDEFIRNIDPDTADIILDTLFGKLADGYFNSSIIINHDLDYPSIRSLPDRLAGTKCTASVVIMYGGRIVERAHLSDFLASRNIKHYYAQLLSDSFFNKRLDRGEAVFTCVNTSCTKYETCTVKLDINECPYYLDKQYCPYFAKCSTEGAKQCSAVENFVCPFDEGMVRTAPVNDPSLALVIPDHGGTRGTHAAGKPILTLEHIDFRYGNNERIYENCSLTVHENEFIFLSGNSGAGKSTVVKIVTGQIAPEGGTVTYSDGTVYFEDGRYIHNRRISPYFRYIPQLVNESFGNARMTVADYLTRSFRYYRSVYRGMDCPPITDALIGEKLTFVNLDRSFLTKMLSELSGGEKQRLAIARLLYWPAAMPPSVFIFDEALTSLDVNVKYKLLNLILDVVYFGLKVSILMISHDKETVGIIRDEMDRRGGLFSQYVVNSTAKNLDKKI